MNNEQKEAFESMVGNLKPPIFNRTKKFLKIILIIFIALILAVFALIAYQDHQQDLRKQQYSKDALVFLHDYNKLVDDNLVPVGKYGFKTITPERQIELAENLSQARNYRTDWGESFVDPVSRKEIQFKKIAMHLDKPIDGVSDIVVYYADFLPFDFATTAINAGYREGGLIWFYNIDERLTWNKKRGWHKVELVSEEDLKKLNDE
ncbi:hypothetical protein ROS59_003780 [Enterobacter cloacae]|nr:hypothetical protein [Enterobacter cloacae]